MTHDRQSALSAGFRLLWRRQKLLWWVYVVNLLCGALGTVPAWLRLRAVLAHSLAGERLTNRFDLGMWFELTRLPEVSIMRYSTASLLLALVFLVFMLFVTGGVLETYREDRRLTTSEFFAASGAFFWPFVRLLLLSIIPFVIVGLTYHALIGFADSVGDRAAADQVGIFLRWGAMLVLLLLALALRLWLDIAQVRAVAQKERRMWRNLWQAWRMTWHEVGRLYGMYFLIALVAWITLAVGVAICAKLPPTATPAVLLVLELIMFAQVATRLWQLAGAMAWYQRHVEMVPADAVEFTTPHPQEIGEASSMNEPPPPSDPGPELPPADA